MAWLLLVIAGLFETAWAVGLKYTQGFTRPLPTALTITAIVVSMGLLGVAAKTLPIGTAYGVWVGIGAVGAAVLGIVLFDEPATFGRLFFVALLLVSVVGLKLTSP
jgi:quaternary ammonium compound-resistance protein SugE